MEREWIMGEETELTEKDIQRMGYIIGLIPYVIDTWQSKILKVLALYWNNPGINTIVTLGWKELIKKPICFFTFRAHTII